MLESKVGWFQPGAFYQKLFAYAYLFVKFDLGVMEQTPTSNHKKLVGYLATTHLPAYETEKAANSRTTRPLSLLHEKFNDFQKTTLREEDESVAFAVIAGDFNLCNISKCKCVNQYICMLVSILLQGTLKSTANFTHTIFI